MPYDRDEVLARTDLGALADEVLGPHHGVAAPPPGAPRSQPRSPDGAHAPGEPVPLLPGKGTLAVPRMRGRSTAADLVMTTQGVGFGNAIALLGARAGIGEQDDQRAPLHRRAVEHRTPGAGAVSAGDIENHVAACETHLWSPAGAPMRRWLARRGLGEEVLRANRVGADPGPRSLPRRAGLPQ